MAERVMPHNYDAEQAVLGAMFLSKYVLKILAKNYSIQKAIKKSFQ